MLDRVPRTPRRPAALAGTMFRGRDAVAEGLLTPADLRSCAWQQVLHGIYADAALTVSTGAWRWRGSSFRQAA
jgi:hypothetical protein